MTLQTAVERRCITEVVHFTTNHGIVGALECRHLLSRPYLQENKHLRHVLKLNALVRPEEFALFDESEDWVRFVNLSISEINKRFFDISRRWHSGANVWWCIFAFDPSIMTHDGVRFATTNNGYDLCCRARGEEGFEALFAPQIPRLAKGRDGMPWTVARETRPDHLPTCEQAEVLYPERLSLDYLNTVYVEEVNQQDIVVGLLNDFNYNGVDVVLQPEKYVGRKN